MSNEEIEIKTVPLYFTDPKLGTELYAWGTISTHKMTKVEYDEMFGSVIPSDNSIRPTLDKPDSIK